MLANFGFKSQEEKELPLPEDKKSIDVRKILLLLKKKGYPYPGKELEEVETLENSDY